MPDASEEEFWVAVADRLPDLGLTLSDTFSTGEIDSAVMGDELRAAHVARGRVPPVEALPLPLRDQAFRDRLEPPTEERARSELESVSTEVLMAGLGPKPGDVQY